MNWVHKKALLWIGILAIIGLAVVVYRVTALGIYLNELPFKGAYVVSCEYHTDCSTHPPVDNGWGLDWVHSTQASSGKTIYASGLGTVTKSQNAGTGWGETIVVSHPDGYKSRYAHLLYRFTALNQKMRAGSPIGYIGNTGCGNCGPHLHWQIYLNTDTGNGVEPIPIDGVTTSFCEDCTYTNTGFATYMRLVDNTGSGFSLTGTAPCQDNTVNGYHENGLNQGVVYFRHCNGLLRSSNPNPTRIGTWTPTPALPFSGNYHVYVYMPVHNGVTLTGQAYYEIFSNNTLIATVVKNQHTYTNDWVKLGLFNLSTSGSYIRLTNRTGDGGRPAFDAVMFVQDF